MDTTLFLAICAIVLIYGIRATRRKAIRLQEAEYYDPPQDVRKVIDAQLDRVLGIAPNEDETTPPSEPLADEDDGATEELDREAVFLAYLHLRESGILEE